MVLSRATVRWQGGCHVVVVVEGDGGGDGSEQGNSGVVDVVMAVKVK